MHGCVGTGVGEEAQRSVFCVSVRLVPAITGVLVLCLWECDIWSCSCGDDAAKCMGYGDAMCGIFWLCSMVKAFGLQGWAFMWVVVIKLGLPRTCLAAPLGCGGRDVSGCAVNLGARGCW